MVALLFRSRIGAASSVVLSIAVLLAPLAARAQSQSEPLALETAVTRALENNPDLAAARARAGALAEVPPQAGALPDPRFGIENWGIPTDRFRSGEEWWYRLRQDIPFPGKRRLRAEAASQEARAADRQTEETRLALVRDVRQSWWVVFYLDRALEIVDYHRQALKQFVTIAETKYKVGQGLQQDVLLAQLEFSRLLDAELSLREQRAREQARLNALLNRPADTALVLPAQADTPLPTIPADTALIATAQAQRPLLAAVQRSIDAAQARVDLARKEYYPDFMVGATYVGRDGAEDAMAAEIYIDIPLQLGRRRHAVAEQRNRLSEERLRLEAARQQIAETVAQAAASYRRGRDQASLYQTGIIPQARQTVASMRSGYQVNKVDFLNLVRAQITLYDYERDYWRAFTQAQASLAQLQAATGQEEFLEKAN